MDFFEAQAAARRSTVWLIVLFAAAVLALVVVTVGLVAVVTAWTLPPAGLLSWHKVVHALSPQLAAGIAGAVLIGIGAASFTRLLSLADGGRAVAEGLDGRLVAPNSVAPAERRLLNVVEEMAIAAGLPVPPVYVIDAPGINAFAAGYSADDAVIGVTRDTLELLDRHELQGVIGHEFSHVLNGDMRLNLRLLALLFGIVAVGVMGRRLVGLRGSTRARRGRGFGTAQTAMLAVGLIVIGYVGTLFGNLIKAAVSRQREFLADASAVQFTRDPSGIAGALRKVGALADGAAPAGGRATELSHMLFAPVASSWFELSASHPPLERRIRAIDPAWDGTYPLVRQRHPRDGEPSFQFGATGSATLSGSAAGAARSGAGAAPQVQAAAAVERARALIDGLPRAFHDAVHEPFGARAGIYALLLPGDGSPRHDALAFLAANTEPGVSDVLHDLLGALPHLPAGARLTLVRLAMPALKQLSRAQFQRFQSNVTALIRFDGSLSRFEWILHHVLLKELRPQFEPAAHRRRSGSARIEDEAAACRLLLALLAAIDHADRASADAACRAGLQTLGLTGPAPALPDRIDGNQKRLTAALRRLRRLHPLAQPRLLKAAIATVQHDGVVSPGEHELLQGLAAALDCPLPQLGQRPLTPVHADSARAVA